MTTRRSPSASALAVVAIVTFAALVLGGCADPGSPTQSPSPGAQGLAGRTFLSTAVTDGGAPFALVPGTRISLTFQAADLGASAGCNSIGGQYRVEDGHLVFSGGSMTEMACPGGRDAQDSWLVSILTARPTVILAGNDLTLETGTIRITFLDREIAQPDQPLVGPQWTVTGIITGDAVSSMPAGIVASLTFDASGTVAVATGCNTGSGRWTAHDATLEITDLALTKKACAPPAGQVESAIVEVLRGGTLSLTIDAGSMTLTAGGRGLQLQALLPD